MYAWFLEGMHVDYTVSRRVPVFTALTLDLAAYVTLGDSRNDLYFQSSNGMVSYRLSISGVAGANLQLFHLAWYWNKIDYMVLNFPDGSCRRQLRGSWTQVHANQ